MCAPRVARAPIFLTTRTRSETDRRTERSADRGLGSALTKLLPSLRVQRCRSRRPFASEPIGPRPTGSPPRSSAIERTLASLLRWMPDHCRWRNSRGRRMSQTGLRHRREVVETLRDAPIGLAARRSFDVLPTRCAWIGVRVVVHLVWQQLARAARRLGGGHRSLDAPAHWCPGFVVGGGLTSLSAERRAFDVPAYRLRREEPL